MTVLSQLGGSVFSKTKCFVVFPHYQGFHCQSNRKLQREKKFKKNQQYELFSVEEEETPLKNTTHL